MRGTLLITSLWLGCATLASAQTPSRFTVGPVARVDHVYLDGDTDGTTAVAGIIVSVRVSRAISIEGELTGGGRDISRSYEGQFVSFPPAPTTSREDFERYAPTARRTLGYAPGVGVAGMVVARTTVHPRVRLAGRLGVLARPYTETSTYLLLSIPEGVDPALVARNFQPESVHTVRGGLLFGIDTDVALTDRFTIAPQVRFVYSGPAEFANTHRELGLGVAARWQF